ncbi:MAG TPA: hypothetical protein VKL22_02555, partial [Actinomycetota bacterium]|nr:hypothetical protein [Actinomycetota bacterium]
TPSPSASTTPGPTPSPTTSVLGGGFLQSPTPSPTTSVLGVNITRRPGLPVTGANALPLVLLAAMCYLFGAVALRFSSRARGARGFWGTWFLAGRARSPEERPGDGGSG